MGKLLINGGEPGRGLAACLMRLAMLLDTVGFLVGFALNKAGYTRNNVKRSSTSSEKGAY